ncbi:MBL fold metallo-hydrolase [Amycolatopsis sp. H20-H5]|uniref:MBL fold metallo-hydrolase n=1 Tax=Amycolatopsis sp. H20-H5 TaxID=3046309 RepID=UPI002DBACB87|nr:MBL fold metallo-hydrolase [Amycolatopsis sp. H20-H5]MEC3982630.1 MBL fold metallo-hydrolase [Amycolatopsis sp. H20-H5]
MDTITLGDIEITRVIERPPAGLPREFIFPDVPRATWEAHRSWLAPEFWHPESDETRSVMQTWLVRSEGKTILIDTGVGNGKERPYMPFFAHYNTDFLGSLARAGVRPEDVDLVVNTHVHGDHVGWNTTLEDRQWVPTFPNARYVIARADFDYWNPENEHKTRSGRQMQNVFEDSVAPVHHAGQTVLWEDHFELDGGLRVDPAPGHTPGSSVVTLTSGTDRAVFVGDLLHSPLQFAEPDCCPSFDEDEQQARAARRRVLGWAADHNALVLPAHLPGAGAAEIRRDGAKFAIKEWAAFA